MNLASWLQYLEALPSGLNNYSLENIKNVAKKLELLNFPGKIIIVGGTNGKGSCVIFLESILLAAGYKTGSYISPHVLQYNERIRINGKDVDSSTLCKTFTKVERARANTNLSYFEYTTLIALTIFKKQKLDILILEVGLGGKFDAVNILNPDIAIITTISLDHTKILGKTRELIGHEKAGIMRPFKPIICGDPNIPKIIYAISKKNKSTLYCINKEFSYTKQNKHWHWYCSNKSSIKKLPLPKLPIANAATALMAIELLKKDLKFSKKSIVIGLKNAFLPGRWHSITIGKAKITFDVAHNPESAMLLGQNLRNDKIKGRILGVMSMLSDKDIVSTLQSLTKIVHKWYIGTLNNARAANSKQLKICLLKAGCPNFVSLPDISIALQQAIAECRIKDRIVVFGSFHTVAEGLKMVNNNQFLYK